MHYVKHFDILGVDTAQIPCIELQGVPNTATEGAVGLLGMNMLSDDHELYVCVAVNGSVYTWKPLKDGKDGVSIVKAELNDTGELIIILSDGTVNNVGVIKGEKGDPGEKGEQADLTKIKEVNQGRYLSVWLGDKETYKGLSATEENTCCFIEDDDAFEKINNEIVAVNGDIDILNKDVETIKNDLPNICKIVGEVEDFVGTANVAIQTLEKNTTDIEQELGGRIDTITTSLFDKNNAVAVQKARDFDRTTDKDGNYGELYLRFAQIGISNYKGTKNIAPLNGYNKDKGTIEDRLTNLGFKTGSISNSTSSNLASNVTLTKVGYYAILRTKQNFVMNDGGSITETFNMVMDGKPLKSDETLDIAIKAGSSNGAIRFTQGSDLVEIIKPNQGNVGIYSFSIGFKIVI